MTNKEAIEIIRKEYLCVDRDCDIDKSCGKCDLMMPSKEPILEAYKVAIKALEQEPCEDAISREKAKQFLYERLDRLNDDELYDIFSRIIDDMYNELPSVKPQEAKWIPIKTRPLTDKEKEEYAYLGYSEDSINFMYDCPLPEDGEEVLITTRYDEVKTDTFYRDEGCYFETYCDEDDVKAWMPLPKPYEPQERSDKE